MKKKKLIQYITKASGEKERFNIKKFIKSLVKSGASSDLVNKILEEIKNGEQFSSAKDIYRFASHHLRQHHKGVAGRYNLKAALMELGPTGYPFEKFVAQIFKHQDFKIKLNQIAVGFCVSHEIDVIVKKEDKCFMVECKFHNRQGLKTTVKVPLYVKARFDDVKKHWIKTPKQNGKYHEAWIFTNTKFTSNAISYAQCAGINIVGWSYPDKNNLPQLIDNLKLYPVTTLSMLNKKQKKILIDQGIVLCKQVGKNKQLLKDLGFSKTKVEEIISEAEAICSLTLV